MPARAHRTLDRAAAEGYDAIERAHSERVAAFWAAQRRRGRGRAGGPARRALQPLPAHAGDRARRGPRRAGEGRQRPRLRGPLLLGRGDLRPAVPHPRQPGVGEGAAARALRHAPRRPRGGRARSATRARCSRGARSTARRPPPGTRPAPRSTTSTPTSPTRMHHYNRVSGDLGFLLEQGAEVLVETARFWMELGFFSERRDGAVLHPRGDRARTSTRPSSTTTPTRTCSRRRTSRSPRASSSGSPPPIRSRTPRSPATGAHRRRGRGLAPRRRAHVRAARRGARDRAPGRALPRAQALGLRGHAAREAPAAAALPPARALPPPGDQADRRRARHLPRRPPLLRRGEAAHVRLLRPAHHRRLDAVGLHPERDGVRGRLPRGGAATTSAPRARSTSTTCTATRRTASTSPPAAAPGSRSWPASAACATSTARCASPRGCPPSGAACASRSRCAASGSRST